MLKVFSLYVLTSFFALFIFSCEPIEEPDVREEWKMVQGFMRALPTPEKLTENYLPLLKLEYMGKQLFKEQIPLIR